MAINKDAGIKIGPFGSALKKELLVKWGYKVYGQENVFENDMEIGNRFISKNHFQRLKSCQLIEGDFVISMMGTIGQCMIIPHDFHEGIMDSHLLRMRVDEMILDKQYLIQIFKSKVVIDQVKRLSVGGIMDGLSSSIFKRITIPLPPTLAEQRAIATALSDVDALIAGLDKLIEKKKAIKQGAMQELLTGKTRLAGFDNGAGYKMTEVGRIPSDWTIQKFGNVGDTIIGLTYSPHEVASDGKLVHRSSNIQNNKLTYLDNVYVLKDIPEKLRLKENDILICVRNGSRDLIGKAALIVGESIGETFGAFMSVFRSSLYPPLVFQYVISDIVQKQINMSLGATINQITNKTLNSFEIPFPPTLAEQRAIAITLSNMDSEIEELETKRDKYKKIKQGMMQELLTGKTRLV